MDIDILSAEKYQEGVSETVTPVRRSRRDIILYGGLLASSPPGSTERDALNTQRMRRSSSKASLLGVDRDGIKTRPRPRGRPRVDTSDRTNTEVRLLVSPTLPAAQGFPLVPRSRPDVFGLSPKPLAIRSCLSNRHARCGLREFQAQNRASFSLSCSFLTYLIPPYRSFGERGTDRMQRRRTQIRLAQRAYRQRKETTISGLNRRVVTLENTIKHMHRAYITFHDTMSVSGIEHSNPAVGEYLKMTADRIAYLAKQSTRSSESEEEDILQGPNAEDIDIGEHRSKRQRGDTIQEPSQGPILGYETAFIENQNDLGEDAQPSRTPHTQLKHLPSLDVATTQDDQQRQVDELAMNKLSSGTQEPLHHDAFPVTIHYAQQRYTASDVREYPFLSPEIAAAQIFPPPMALPSLPNDPLEVSVPTGNSISDIISLPSPKSYAFQEASFARRLLRFSIEAAYELLTSPSSRPEDLQRLCRLSWCFTNTTHMADKTQGLLGRTAQQHLELWDVPTRHVGGAGLHYPRVGIDTSGAPPDWWATSAPLGPLPFLEPHTPVPESMPFGEVIEQAGFGGEWFDPNDVEQYLRSKGLYLDGQSSIVELIEDERGPTLSDAQGAPSTSPAPSLPPDNTDGLCSPHSSDGKWGGNVLQFADEGLPDLAFSALPDFTSTLLTRTRRYVDVEKFLDGA